MRQAIKKIFLFFAIPAVISSCNYLDVVPDNVATIENAFTLRSAARKYLYTCYSYMPQHGTLTTNPSYVGYEMWPLDFYRNNVLEFIQGNQNVSSPLLNFWEGLNSGGDMFQAIRDCNIFLENIQNVPDMPQGERDQWAAEVKVLKAYYHYYLILNYGPIPLIRENLPIDATIDEVRLRREPVDVCFDYVESLINEALPHLTNLPYQQVDRPNYGRITYTIAAALKAKMMATAASPLFNGNPDYANYIDPELGPLFNPTYSPEKWVKAMNAAKEAIDAAEGIGMALYTFEQGRAENLSDNTLTKMSIREAFASRDINGEVIWSNTNSYALQSALTPRSWNPAIISSSTYGSHGPTLNIAQMFYTDKGLPIDQDRTWDYNNRFDIKVGDEAHKYNIAEGYETVALHFNREPRFYANVGFDGGIWYGQGKYDDNDSWHLEIRATRYTAVHTTDYYSPTGYYPKKVINYQNYLEGSTYYVTSYLFPIVRLADIYLLYAEAANEVNGPGPESFEYLNRIRERAGIPTVQESWDNYSTFPGKYNTKEGLREIIHQERRIELNNESQVYWDLLRWKTAERVLSEPIQGWDISGKEPEEFYQPTLIFQRQFRKRDYFTPIREYELQRNQNLMQSPGW